MKKIRMNCAATLDETFADFLLSRRAKGLAEKTLESYSFQWKAVARHLDKVFQSLHFDAKNENAHSPPCPLQ